MRVSWKLAVAGNRINLQKPRSFFAPSPLQCAVAGEETLVKIAVLAGSRPRPRSMISSQSPFSQLASYFFEQIRTARLLVA